MKERDFLGWVLDVAARTGWRAWHVPMPVRPVGGGRFVPEARARGLPDLILIHDDPPRLIFAELKGTGGKLSEEQREFLRRARAVADAQRDMAEAANQVAETAAWAATALGNHPVTAAKMPPLIGVYSWRPGNEDLIEAVLKSKVTA